MSDILDQIGGVDTSTVIRQKDINWKISFPNTSGIDYTRVLYAELHQEMLSHDVLTLKVKGSLEGADRIVAGDPVQFDWAISGTQSTWLGYVYLVETPVNVSSGFTRIICLGTSYFMKNANQRVLKNVTADRVASKIAIENDLTPITTRHPRVFPMISQAGQSDWQMVSRLAKQCGFGFRVENNNLIFKPKTELYADSKVVSPYFAYIQQPSTALSPFLTIYNFNPILAEQSPEIEGSIVNRKLSGVDRNTNGFLKKNISRDVKNYALNSDSVPKYVRESATPIFTKIVTDEVVTSSVHAKQVLEGKTETESFRYRAKVTTVGHALVRPYSAIYLDQLPHGMSGYWNVISVAHVFGEKNLYKLNLEVGTDFIGETYTGSTTSPGTRNIAAELAGLVPTPVTYTLENSLLSAKIGANIPPELLDVNTYEINRIDYGGDLYSTVYPDFSQNAKIYRWRSI